MDEFSKAHLGFVRFVQIGASNGLNSDPIREFIVRDQWAGLLVEPLPASFARLKSNYERLDDRDLVFVNAAIVAADQPPGSFWTYSDSFLSGLSAEQRIAYAQKSSFNPDHVASFLHERPGSDQPVVEIPVTHLTLPELMSCYARSPEVDLLVTDCEGYEATLLPSIDWHLFSPTAVLFESHNLGSHEEEVYEALARHGYVIFRFGGDSLGVKGGFLQEWRRRSRWVARSLADPITSGNIAPLSPASPA